jgi:hypothetical protein
VAQAPSVQIQKIYVHRDENLVGVEVFEGMRIKFYSYTYYVNVRDAWLPCVRWDNAEQQPHVDRYDETGTLIEQQHCREKSFKEVLKLVKIFRRNLAAMNLGEL